MEKVVLKVDREVKEFDNVEEAIAFIDQIAYEDSVDYYDDRVQRIYEMEKHFSEYTNDEEYNNDKSAKQAELIESGEGLEVIKNYIDEFELKKIRLV